jgi:hypothetical protein
VFGPCLSIDLPSMVFLTASNQLHRIALHIVVGVDVAHGDLQISVASKACQHANANALGCQRGDEGPAH